MLSKQIISFFLAFASIVLSSESHHRMRRQNDDGVEELVDFVNVQMNLTDNAMALRGASGVRQRYNIMNRLFMQHLKSKARSEGGIPSHVRQAIHKWKAERRQQTENGDRAVDTYCPNGGCTVPMTLAGIYNYGCWCNFDNELTQGSGQPVTKHDELCRDYQLCLRCARHDGKTDGYPCDPITQGYTAKFKGFTVDCKSAQPADVCAIHTCMCEQDLIAELVNLLWSNVFYDNTYLHSKMEWDPDANCPGPVKPKQNGMQCCGEYPDRFPFGGTKECCENVNIFSAPVQQCCGFGDGTVHDIGSC